MPCVNWSSKHPIDTHDLRLNLQQFIKHQMISFPGAFENLCLHSGEIRRDACADSLLKSTPPITTRTVYTASSQGGISVAIESHPNKVCCFARAQRAPPLSLHIALNQMLLVSLFINIALSQSNDVVAFTADVFCALFFWL
jgi:hypothetical protein